jgi:hypothetical protein
MATQGLVTSGNSVQVQDGYGHLPPLTGNVLTAGAVSTTAIGTIAPTTAAGASPTVTFASGQSAIDMAGSFTLSPVTGGGAQAAGAVAVITFNNGLPAVPRAIICTIFDDAGAAAVAASAISKTAQGFSFSVGVALTTAHTYTCQYEVIL